MIEFIGSKRLLASTIGNAISTRVGARAPVADLFCGTGSISAWLRGAGHRVVANDQLALCSTFAEAILLNETSPRFAGLSAVSGIDPGVRYLRVLERLMEAEPIEGFVYRNYSARDRVVDSTSYFTAANAMKIDGIRAAIERLEPVLTRGERALLLSDLLRATVRVSNTAGTYGCYLKTWKSRALESLALSPTELDFRGGAKSGHAVYSCPVDELPADLGVAAIYADPPYTKRQYAAYYHVLETIVRNDQPPLVGKTGLRPWTEQASDFCYRRRASAALRRLIGRLQFRWFFLSYSDDGHLSEEEIREILEPLGTLEVLEFPYRRYRSNGRAHRRSSVVERFYCLERAA